MGRVRIVPRLRSREERERLDARRRVQNVAVRAFAQRLEVGRLAGPTGRVRSHPVVGWKLVEFDRYGLVHAREARCAGSLAEVAQ